jgi:hypothetical protein
MKSNERAIIFNKVHNLDDWEVVNDSVMGGISVGNIQLNNQTLVFSGNLSTENNGGFSSVYKKSPKLPEIVKSVSIRIQGDGNRYQLRMRSQVTGYELAYKIEFDTLVDKIETHRFNLANFKATFRGRIIDNAPLLEPHTISHVGFLIATKQSQEFNLSIYTVDFF